MPGVCCHQKKHNTVIDCQSWKMPGKPSTLVSPWAEGETGPRTEDRALIFSGPDRMLVLGGGKNPHCLRDAVLSLNLNLISSFIQPVNMEHLLCAYVPNRIWRRNTHIHIPLPVLSTF